MTSFTLFSLYFFPSRSMASMDSVLVVPSSLMVQERWGNSLSPGLAVSVIRTAGTGGTGGLGDAYPITVTASSAGLGAGAGAAGSTLTFTSGNGAGLIASTVTGGGTGAAAGAGLMAGTGSVV